MNRESEKDKEEMEKDPKLEEVEESAAQEEESSDVKENTDNAHKEEVAALKDQLLRSMADIENLRIRHDKQLSETREYAITNFAKDLIAVLDNFTMALTHIPENLPTEMTGVVDGIKMTYKELLSIFKKHGIEAVSPEAGDKFNYHEHHAISEAQTNDLKPGHIVSTMQIGYKMKDRLLRPASVVIAKK